MNATQVYYPQGLGQLTAMGMRQMYLRGREMRKRYIEDTTFLSQRMNPDEFYAYSTPVDRTYMSAMAFMMGLYPLGTGSQMFDNQTASAVPPMPVDNLEQIKQRLGTNPLENGFQTVPIHSDSGDLESMLFRGYDPLICPIIGEIQMFEAINNTKVNSTFENYKKTLYPLLQNKFSLNKSEPFDIEVARYITDEIHTNQYEKRYVNYTFTPEEQALINNFTHDDHYLFKFNNDTITTLANNELFKFISRHFDWKANATLGHVNTSNQYLTTQRYYYSQIHQQHLIGLILGFQLEQQFRYLPKYTSSLLIEFHQRDFTLPDDGSDPVYSRENYYIKLYLDDIPIKLPNATCDDNYKCTWDSVHEFMRSRLFKDVVNNGQHTNNIRNFCFTHLNYQVTESTYEENLPWWLAFVIALPLVGITIAIIKIFLILKNKRDREQIRRQRQVLQEGGVQYGRLNG
eukprot:403370640